MGNGMRIRTTKPEFWTSEDTAALDWETRLLFVGLWSYVDDNGVGRDNARLILASLFPLDDNPRESLARISRGLARLSARGMVTRYTVDGRDYLCVMSFNDHQKIDHPGKSRHPLPTSENAVIRVESDSNSRESRESLAPVVSSSSRSESGSRSQELNTCPAKPNETPTTDPWLFSEFWKHYPRKVRKDAARKAWSSAVKRADPDYIVAAADRMAHDPNLPNEQFIPYPATWLNQGGWDDAPYPTPETRSKRRESTSDRIVSDGMSLAAKFAAEEAATRPQLGASK